MESPESKEIRTEREDVARAGGLISGLKARTGHPSPARMTRPRCLWWQVGTKGGLHPQRQQIPTPTLPRQVQVAGLTPPSPVLGVLEDRRVQLAHVPPGAGCHQSRLGRFLARPGTLAHQRRGRVLLSLAKSPSPGQRHHPRPRRRAKQCGSRLSAPSPIT